MSSGRSKDAQIHPLDTLGEEEISRGPTPGPFLIWWERSGEGSQAPQHFLYFLPEPQGHGSLRPTLVETAWVDSAWA